MQFHYGPGKFHCLNNGIFDSNKKIVESISCLDDSIPKSQDGLLDEVIHLIEPSSIKKD